MQISPASSPIRKSSRIPVAVAIVWLLFAVTACASSPTHMSIRIMIEFRAPTDGAARELLTRLESRSGVTFRYAASVSPQRHAYELRCPPRDSRCDAAIQQLREDPAVLDIVSDTLRNTHPAPP